MNEKTLNKIISAAYDDCGLIERLKIRILILKNPEAKRIYDSYSISADAVHSLGQEEINPVIIDRAAAVNNTPRIKPVLFYKPAIALSVILIAALIAVFNIIENRKPAYTTAQLVQADRQAEQSLALVGRILNQTTNTLSRQILPEKVSKPVKKGLTIINYLIGG